MRPQGGLGAHASTVWLEGATLGSFDLFALQPSELVGGSLLQSMRSRAAAQVLWPVSRDQRRRLALLPVVRRRLVYPAVAATRRDPGPTRRRTGIDRRGDGRPAGVGRRGDSRGRAVAVRAGPVHLARRPAA